MTQEYTINQLNKQFLDSEDIIENRVPFMSEMMGTGDQLQAEQQALATTGGALTKGVIQGGLGFPADLVGLVTGLLNMATVDPEGKGNLQQFAEGYGAVPFTSEKIATMLEELGWKYEGVEQAPEVVGEFIAPTKALEVGIKNLVKAFNP